MCASWRLLRPQKETDDPWNNHVRRGRPLAPGLTFLGRTATVAA